jgi:hypothetical protein
MNTNKTFEQSPTSILSNGLADRMRRFLKYFSRFLYYSPQREIMIIRYEVSSNKIECVDWVSKKINAFCGVFDNDMIERIKPYCTLGDFPSTRIYIWAGIEKKHLAYNEPVDNYLKDVGLWKTGQGLRSGRFNAHDDVRKASDSMPILVDRLPSAEDVKRWHQLLVGKGEIEMKKDIEATLDRTEKR